MKNSESMIGQLVELELEADRFPSLTVWKPIKQDPDDFTPVVFKQGTIGLIVGIYQSKRNPEFPYFMILISETLYVVLQSYVKKL